MNPNDETIYEFHGRSYRMEMMFDEEPLQLVIGIQYGGQKHIPTITPRLVEIKS